MSNDLSTTINAATNRILALQKEYADAEASANAHEQAARADRLRMAELKKERSELNTVLSNSQIQQKVLTSQQMAAQAQANAETAQREAEKSRDEANRARAEADKLLTELRAQKVEMEKATEQARSLAQSTSANLIEQTTAQPAD